MKRQVITLKYFKELIKEGRMLVLLDDLIIDIKNYIPNHPGGKKVLLGNIGRDISKFFYGGYQYENLNQVDDTHTHSSDAKALALELVIGVLEKSFPSETKVKLKNISEKVGMLTKTFTFESESKREGLQTYYSDLSMMGKHFLVYHPQKKNIKRHYTICNSLEPEMYSYYLRLIVNFVQFQ